MTKSRLFASLAVGTVLTFSMTTYASTPKGNAEHGRTLIYTCGGCHGVTGYRNAYPNYHVPRIAGQNYDYLVNALSAYKSGDRPHPTMRAQGESLSDADIHDIAAYLSNLNH